MSHKPPTIEALTAECARWNAAVPVGSAVIVSLDSGEERHTVTRSKAEVLSGHTAVIWLEGITGCYLLSRVMPQGAPPAKPEAHNCAGEILDTESDDRTATKPCPRPATWVNCQTGSPFCGAHKEVIERAFPPEEGGPTFRPFDCHDAGAADQDHAPPPQGCETPHAFEPVKDNRYCGTCGAGRLHKLHQEAPPSV